MHTLTVERTLNAPPGHVWRCMTEPALIARWFAPAPVTVTHVDVEARPGGAFHLVMDVPDVGDIEGVAGCALEAVPEERLTWTSALGPGFAPNPAPAEGAFHFTAIMTLAPLEAPAEGTRYRAEVIHADAAGRAAHEAMGSHDGWAQTAEQLGNLAATL